MYLKKDSSNEIIFNKNLNESTETNKPVSTKKDSKNEANNDLLSNKTINQIKFSSQEQQKISLDEQKLQNKTKINSFSDLISVCISKREIELKYELENNVNLISFKNNNIEISFNENLDKNFIKNLTSKLLDWTGERWIILLSKKPGSKSMREIKSQDTNRILQDLKESETYKKAINLFPDIEVINVKNTDEQDND